MIMAESSRCSRKIFGAFLAFFALTLAMLAGCSSSNADCYDFCQAINRSNSYGYCLVEYWYAEAEWKNDTCWAEQKPENWPNIGSCVSANSAKLLDLDPGFVDSDALYSVDVPEDGLFWQNLSISPKVLADDVCQSYFVYNPLNLQECDRVCDVMTNGQSMPKEFKTCLSTVNNKSEMLQCQARLQRSLELQEQ